jgi:outer membrane receptor protein involved in Fe transport
VTAAPTTGRAADSDAAETPSNPATVQELPQVLVIGNAPLPGFGLPLNQIPSNVQTAGGVDLERQQSTDVADYMSKNFSGVSVSESADNPFQLDINYHGFTASPLLGTPEGLSVYVDGVRVNEAFGDTVNWDLIPESAIQTVSLIGGSNPVFGLNTLGGALSVQTKSGHENPGTELEAYGGSFGRHSFQAQTGGEFGAFDYFATGNYFDETGWRDLSPTRVWQGFGKVGWQTDTTDLDLSYTYADTSLYGNGAIPLSMLYFRKQQSYTPDFTADLLHFINLTGTQSLTDHLLLSGNAFWRHLITGSSNGSNNDNYLDENYGGPPLDCTDPATDRVTLAYCSNSASEVSRLVQSTLGVGLQITDSQDLFGFKNQAIVGVDFTNSSDDFAQQFQYGSFAPNHLLIDTPSPLNDETVIALHGTNKIWGLYLTDTVSPSDQWHINLSARYNRNNETINGFSVDSDVGDAGDGFDTSSPLLGDHSFVRINPALGLTYTPGNQQTFYANYNEASRAPTVIELGCANPAQPCGLPNDFASDPDLKQVVARTFEIGLRGNLINQALNWSADLFRTTNSNDIQFVATTTNSGYFDNVGNTLRQGFDLGLGGTEGGLKWRFSYSFVNATYQSTFDVSAESNSTADADGNISVHPGDRIPLIPRSTGRLVLDYDYQKMWDLGATLIVSSGSYLHGDENNANVAGGTNGEGAFVSYPTGTGWIPSYAVVNFQGTYHIGSHVDIFAKMVNAFNQGYATAGFLTSNTFDPNGTFRPDPDSWTNENAVSPATPRAIWAGARIRF